MLGWQNVRGGDFIHIDENQHHFHLINDTNLGNHICPIEVDKNIDISLCKKCVFTLELEEEKYFIGTTSHLNKAIYSEWYGGKKSSEWTKLYKPIKLIRVIHVKDQNDFSKTHIHELKRAFLKYRCEDVRGGAFNLIHPESHYQMIIGSLT